MLLQGSHEPGDVWLRTLAANLDSMKSHRPALYVKVMRAIPAFELTPDEIRINPSRTDARALEIFGTTQLLRQGGRAVALAGIGDGRVLRAHARFLPALILGRQQEVIVIEPDFTRLIGGLGLTDLSGPRGAFEQKRITWYVGPDWIDELSNELIEQHTRVAPMRAEPSTTARPEIEDGIAEVQARILAAFEARRDRIHTHYENKPDAELLDVLSSNPSRKPRMLLLASQFSAVLQYSTADAAQALGELGWEVEIATEREMFHSMAHTSVVASIDAFRPDIVFQIDHLRYEFKDLIPANLPFVCWIQDHLTNLTNDFAGNSIGERDFVLTGGAYRYVNRYSYPRRQCVDMPKCSRPPKLPRYWTCEREDLLYVSHWSHTADNTTSDLCGRIRELAGVAAEGAMRECCTEMIRAYGRGESFKTDLAVRTMVRGVFTPMNYGCEEKTEQFFVDVLFQRLNQVFYRQQSLNWAAEIAEELGLKFGIYGKGWEKHPTLSRFARGVVKYGDDLEVLTRESKILLQIEPYACYTHQRMLDALLTGGFTLIREHPLNTLPVRIRQFLDAYVPAGIISVPDAMASLSPPLRAEFEQLLGECEIIAAMGDVVDVVRGWQRAGIIGDGDEVLPHLGEIAFDSKESLRERIQFFIEHDARRRQIASEQRETIMMRLTYREALDRAMRRIHALLVDSCAAASIQLREAA